ncbi:hypothetical protein DICVIV_13536 [Dictyocaulus viviparus]|uniref:Uncharacterized protein n=1 Tax=Dictyocaulus viviparus TaxID=29172 RepID=A0A0D8XDI6_DICVI|nr:hypothetical protein DICVIV_13536 [Dictyocaulus viviparus]
MVFSGTRSPSLEEMYRRRPSFTRPPIRGVNSPRLTDEEADQLTSPFFQSYNPDKPPAWEVPNINNNVLHIASPDYAPYHFSAPSIIHRVFQKVTNIVFALFNALYWLLHLVTIRFMKTIALLLYDSSVCVLWIIRAIGEYVSVFVYNISSEKSSYLRPCPSKRKQLSASLSRFVHFLRIFLAPVDLTIKSFHKFRNALKRSYYAHLEEKGREINRKAVLSKLEEIKRLEAEAKNFLAAIEARKGARKHGDAVDEHNDGQFNDSGGYNRYNLRHRAVAADTDSEDDIPRRRKDVYFGTPMGLVQSERKSLKTYRIASWLGSTASSLVYYIYYMVHLIILFAKRSYDGAYRAFSFTNSPSTVTGASSSCMWLSARNDGIHPNAKETYLNKHNHHNEQATPIIVPQSTSHSYSIIYMPARTLLFAVFAVGDILCWLYSKSLVELSSTVHVLEMNDPKPLASVEKQVCSISSVKQNF